MVGLVESAPSAAKRDDGTGRGQAAIDIPTAGTSALVRPGGMLVCHVTATRSIKASISQNLKFKNCCSHSTN